jgi:hypothetical protein
MRTDETGIAEIQEIDVEGVPKGLTFSADGEELWLVSYDLDITRAAIEDRTDALPSEGSWYEGPHPGDEAANAFRRTTVRVYSTADWRQLASFSTVHAAISPVTSPDRPDSVYITTSAGSVYLIDRPSRTVVGEVSPGRVGLPIICGDVAL